jgi:hypothetical protein
MTPALFVLEALRLLGPCPSPTRCPYCPPDTPPHWIGWGCYQRYAGDRDRPSRKVAVRRYRCKISLRTFSLLPHALLPYRSVCTGLILEWLHALFVEGVPLSRLARQADVARGTLRGLRAGFLRAVPQLRLPRRDGRQTAAPFLSGVAALPPSVLVPLFQGWKELEPKQCVVGIHSRSRCRPTPPP